MTPQPSTSLRVRFFESQGWKWKDSNTTAFGAEVPLKAWYDPENRRRGLPQLDSNTVREAMMGMTEEEFKLLSQKVYSLCSDHCLGWRMARDILKLPPTTLAELFCEVKGVHE
jgi:hypothetical protein